MNTSIDDDMLKKFFGEHKNEISDNGFTRQVMQKIPQQQSKEWIVWLFAIAGMVLTTYLTITTGLIITLLQILNSIPVYYLLVAVFCFPIIVFLVMICQKNRHVGFG